MATRRCKPPKYRGVRKTGRTSKGVRPCRKKPGPKRKSSRKRKTKKKSSRKRKTKKKNSRKKKTKKKPKKKTKKKPKKKPKKNITFDMVIQFFKDNSQILGIRCPDNQCLRLFQQLEAHPSISVPIKNRQQLDDVLDIMVGPQTLETTFGRQMSGTGNPNLTRRCIICLYRSYRMLSIRRGIIPDNDVPDDYRS